MRFDAITKMTTKTDKKAADILLYLSRCADAIKGIPAPTGITLLFQVKTEGLQPSKAAKIAREAHDSMLNQLGKGKK